MIWETTMKRLILALLLLNKRCVWLASVIATHFVLVACTSDNQPERDVVNDPFPEAQAELREVIQSIRKDVMTANIDGLQAIHLESDKFTKFGPRSFERQDVASTNQSEAAFFSSVSITEYEATDLKIDVFGNIGIATFHPQVTSVKNGEESRGSGRQTVVFLKTPSGWKIVHEHGTPKN
jgi:ketosteroid isomerase-like protein